MCRSGCHQVPEDLWPHCCETHNTCCVEFAESCMHDCLPRVHTGDVSVVEERPGLCCALYNLCCFRETFRITSRKTGKETPVSFPIIHRFHTPAMQTHQAVSSSVVPQGSPQARQQEQIPRDLQPASSPKIPRLFRPQPLKKPSNPLFPQSLTKSPINLQEQGLPAGGKIFVRADDGERRETLTEVKKLRRPKPFSSSLLSGRKDAEEAGGEPKESLGPQRPSFRPFSVLSQREPKETEDTGVGRVGRRPGNRRPKITLKRLRPVPVGQENNQPNTQNRTPQGGRQRPSQQGVRERPEQAIRQRPSQQQTGRTRPQQTTQTTDSRRGGRTQSFDSVIELDQAPAAGRPDIVQAIPLPTPARPQVQVTPDLPQILVDDQLVRIQEAELIQNAKVEDIDTVQVGVDMMKDETKQSTMMDKTDQTGGPNPEVDITDIPGDTTRVEVAEKAAQTVEETLPNQPEQTDLLPQESVVGTDIELSQVSVFPEHQQTLNKDKMIKTIINQDTITQPTNSGSQQSGVRSGNQKASQARTRSGTSQIRGEGRTQSNTRPTTRTRVPEDSRGSGRAQTTRTRSGTRTTDRTSTRGQTRSRSGSSRRVQAQETRAVASDSRQGRRSRRQ
ncbi:hypothetical protein Pcinc_037112 [Petrolisthes cinctipes]|uniref:Uncharacterized protein n=1 Tax=Petrolisthes cinctipes TaxID=88211 RepID=A0AAE1BX67_PETCI|nr:hypothetical protein Pcinc_037112 [Petrolisthes cinctipes]